MSPPVLYTKLHVPLLQPGVIHRPHLIQKLNTGIRGKLTLVSASAGFGKTTLISDWIAASKIPAIWISLDGEHNDPNRFIFYLIVAIQKRFPSIGYGAMEILSSPYAAQSESILTMLLNDIADNVPELNLVLDDYHTLENKIVHDAVAFLIEHMPPQMHVLISSRVVPALPLARLRVQGQLTELSTEDFRFTIEESVDFFKNTMHLELSSENAAILNNRTEGWVAGLQLAALSLKKRDNISDLIENFSGTHQYVLDYLVDEVLSCQPAHIRQFLEKTSILDRMCASLCDAVIEDDSISGQAVLEAAERSNLFIVPLDNERKWFRYHHLFRDLLQKRLQQIDYSAAAEKKLHPRLHMNACRWYDKNGFIMDAFYHAIAAGNFNDAAALAEKIWPDMESNYQHAAFIGLLKMLPENEISKNPVLCAGYAWSLLFTGKLEDAECWLQKAEAWLNREGETSCIDTNSAYSEDQIRELSSSVSFARVYQAQSSGNISESFIHLDRVMKSAPAGNANRYAAFTMYTTALSFWRAGNLQKALQFITFMMDNVEKSGNRIIAQNMTLVKGLLLELTGDLNQAAHLYKSAIEGASKVTDTTVPAMSTLLLKSGLIHLEQGNIKLGELFLEKSQIAGRKASIANWSYFSCLAQSQLKELRNDLNGALDILHEAQKHYVRTPLPDVTPLSARTARLWIKLGRFTEVESWIARQHLGVDDELVYMGEYEHITLARYLLAQYRATNDLHFISDADTLLERLLQAAKDGGRIPCVIEVLNLRALSLDAQNRTNDSLKKIEQAIKAAIPQQSTLLFVNEGAPMVQLLTKAKARGIMADYIDKLLIIFEDVTPDIKAEIPDQYQQSGSENNLLSDRELEVLKLVEKGFSNTQISEKLFISLSTVKGHNLKIFGKLNVKSRTEALVRARELHLL